MNTKSIEYRVAFSGGRNGYLGRDGYSGYHKRITMAINNEISHDQVYGYRECIQHIAEYLGKQDEYTESRQKETLIIQKITTITEQVKYIPIDPIINSSVKIKTISETD